MKLWIASSLCVGILSVVAILMALPSSMAAEPSRPSEKQAQNKETRRAARQAAQEQGATGRKTQRAALAGPASRPAADASDKQSRPRGEAFFRALDRNRDDKLQPEEIGRFINLLTRAHDASKQADLTPETWSRYLEEMRPTRGKGLRAGKGRNRQNAP